MPFKSRAQQRFAYAHPDKFGGAAGLKEWASATNFSALPEKKKKDDPPMAKHWMQDESEREEKAGTKGSTRRLAHKAGMSTRAWAQEHAHDTGAEGTPGAKRRHKAQMALRYMGAK